MSDDLPQDRRLREAFARAVEARPAPAERCPPAEALLAVVRRDGSEDRRLATLDHAAGCPRCRSGLELLRAIDRAGEAEDGRRRVGPVARRAAGIAALAAAAALALTLGLGRWLGAPEPVDTLRGAPEGVALVSPGADAAAAAPLTFAWRSVPGASGYVLEVVTARGHLVLREETAGTTVVLAEDRALPPGEYRWWVRARAAEWGERRSEARVLRISAR